MNRPPGRRFVRPAPLVWWPCHLRGGLLIAKKRPRAGMERRVVGCWLLPAGVGGVARRTASATLVWIAAGAVVGLLVVRAPSWLAGPFGRAAFVAWRSSRAVAVADSRAGGVLAGLIGPPVHRRPRPALAVARPATRTAVWASMVHAPTWRRLAVGAASIGAGGWRPPPRGWPELPVRAGCR